MLRPESLRVPLLLASLALAGAGIAMLSSARNSQVRKLTPVPGVAPAGDQIQSGPAESGSPQGTAAPAGVTPSGAPAPVPHPRIAEKIPDDIQWRTNFQAALDEGRASGKPVMVDFYTDWCGYCKKLDTDVYSDFGIISESANFVSVKVNAEKNSRLAEKYQVSGFPTIIWLDANGTPLETLSGYTDAPDFLQIMRRARSKMPASAV